MTSPTTPAPVAAPTVAPTEPARGLTIAGFVLAFLIAPLGAILSIVALVKINSAGGSSRGLAIAGIIIGALGTIAWIVTIIVSAAILGAAVDMVGTCLDLGPGVWDVDGATITCD